MKKFIKKALQEELFDWGSVFEKGNLRVYMTFLGIVIKSLAVASFFATVWFLFFYSPKFNIHANPALVDILATYQKMLVGAYLVLMHKATDRVLRQNHEIVACENEKNNDLALEKYKAIQKQNSAFLLYHLVVVVVSMTLLGITMVMPRESAHFGFWSIFGTTFALFFVFKSLLHIQDPYVGIWPLRQLPFFLKKTKEEKRKISKGNK